LNRNQPWEIGGEFHWLGLPAGSFISWPQPHVWFALGRDALLAIWRQHSRTNYGCTLLVPDYFCSEVTARWEQAGVIIRRYADDPRWPHPDWDTLDPAPGDLVMAVNYFGVRNSNAWQEWHRKHEFINLIENHTHDPLSRWALSSEADYAFSSMRKTFPSPDGALLWSPRNHPLPPEPQNQSWSGSALKLAGMIWKRDYLAKRGLIAKSTLRSFQVEGEKRLSQTQESSISPWSRALLERGIPKRWRRRREKNIRLLLDLLSEKKGIEPLFLDWPSGYCPYNAILVFASEAIRDEFRSHLIMNGVYTPVHWVVPQGASDRALELSRRVLTIPIDQRYNSKDIHRVFKIIVSLSI
jgi:hypothetical protein